MWKLLGVCGGVPIEDGKKRVSFWNGQVPHAEGRPRLMDVVLPVSDVD
jgi:hypothetical protein